MREACLVDRYDSFVGRPDTTLPFMPPFLWWVGRGEGDGVVFCADGVEGATADLDVGSGAEEHRDARFDGEGVVGEDNNAVGDGDGAGRPRPCCVFEDPVANRRGSGGRLGRRRGSWGRLGRRIGLRRQCRSRCRIDLCEYDRSWYGTDPCQQNKSNQAGDWALSRSHLSSPLRLKRPRWSSLHVLRFRKGL